MEKFIKYTVLGLLFGGLPLIAFYWQLQELHSENRLWTWIWQTLLYVGLFIWAYTRKNRY